MFKKLSFFFYKIIYLINTLSVKFFKRNFLLYFKEFIENDHYVSLNINRKKIKLFVPNNLVKWRVDTFLEKEPETIDWINNFKLKKFNFWDIGANIGQYSIYCAITHPNSIITSFEPSTNNLRILSRNISINQLQEKINIFPVALANEGCNFLKLAESSLEEGSAHNNYGVSDTKQIRKISYKTYGTSIDTILEEKKLPIPNYIKIDVDGVENNILEGGKKFLSAKEILEVSIEINENDTIKFKEIMNFFKSTNFKIKHKKHNIDFHKIPGSENIFNYVFKKII